jgi:hypothetical protein
VARVAGTMSPESLITTFIVVSLGAANTLGEDLDRGRHAHRPSAVARDRTPMADVDGFVTIA